MHVAYLTGVYIHQDEPWYLNIICVWVTCKLHKSRKPGGNWTRDLSLFLKRGQIFARNHSFRISPLSVDCWKRSANTGPNSVASSFRSSPDPKALEWFKPLRSLITPSLETTISSMKGVDLSRSRTWVCSFLLNTSVNWPLNSSPFQGPTEQQPFHSSFSGLEYLGCLFFLTIDVPIEIYGVCLYITNQVNHTHTHKSCCFLTSALISLLIKSF